MVLVPSFPSLLHPSNTTKASDNVINICPDRIAIKASFGGFNLYLKLYYMSASLILLIDKGMRSLNVSV